MPKQRSRQHAARVSGTPPPTGTTATEGLAGASGAGGHPVGPRQPCPCGSGRRYKACHGSAGGPAVRYVSRPFAGLAGECDLVAMREFVPAATAPVRLSSAYGNARAVVLASLLPMAAPALVRQDGTIWLGLQVQHGFGDPSRDLAAVLLRALEADPGASVGLTQPPGEGPRLQDVLENRPLDVTVHEGFGFWIVDLDDPDGSLRASLEQADAAAAPTVKLESVPSAYWTHVGSKEHLRWVMPYDEDPLLDALARLHVTGADNLVDGGRLVGMFRAHGLLVPVWDLPVGTGARAVEQPAAAFAERVAGLVGSGTPLSTEERAARAGLANRQVTLR